MKTRDVSTRLQPDQIANKATDGSSSGGWLQLGIDILTLEWAGVAYVFLHILFCYSDPIFDE